MSADLGTPEAWLRVGRWTGETRVTNVAQGVEEVVDCTNLDMVAVQEDEYSRRPGRRKWVGTADTKVAWTHTAYAGIWTGKGRASAKAEVEIVVELNALHGSSRGTVFSFNVSLPDSTARRIGRSGQSQMEDEYSPHGSLGSVTHFLPDPPSNLDEWVAEGTEQTTLGDFTETSQWLLRGKPGIRKVLFWVNAFIPRDVPGVTKTIPGSGEHAGKTMIPSTVWGDCFRTDQRTFDSDRNASTRLHSEAEIDVVTQALTQKHWCNETIEIDCEDGTEEARAKGRTDRMKFEDPKISSDARTFNIAASAASSNPLVRASRAVGDIDWSGDVRLAMSADGRGAEFTFTGKVDEFPAYEMYVQADDQKPKEVFTEVPRTGASAMNLVGDANRHVSSTVHLHVDP
ncbi:DUF3238 domain-containing protein [Agromyces humi]|uniref:DUF3238 domain-containing protein n=1 Tax=Agromyces humi TaxID=1766800 RepID=UPI0013595F9B|nr:DUF3238 domain-containing protein [Agromyces humi]